MARRLPTLLLGAVVAAALLAGTARAEGVGGTQAFGASPAPDAKTGPRAYYSFTLAAGESKQDKLVLTNGSKAQTLKLGAAYGTTANGSGDAYAGAFASCTGTACWITGLPATVTLAANAHRTIPFTVTVPAGTPDRQYLAGITVEPAARPAATTVGRNGAAGAQAVIIQQVDVGVAITVGDLAQLRSALRISGVSATAVGTLPRLLVTERNIGQTFVHARGFAVCTASGGTHRYSVVSSTILPGDQTVLTVNAPGLPSGKSALCHVNLAGAGGVATSYHGTVHTPATHSKHVVQTGPGTFSEVPTSSGTPTWAIALIAVGGAIALLLVVVVIVLWRRPRG